MRASGPKRARQSVSGEVDFCRLFLATWIQGPEDFVRLRLHNIDSIIVTVYIHAPNSALLAGSNVLTV